MQLVDVLAELCLLIVEIVDECFALSGDALGGVLDGRGDGLVDLLGCAITLSGDDLVGLLNRRGALSGQRVVKTLD